MAKVKSYQFVGMCKNAEDFLQLFVMDIPAKYEHSKDMKFFSALIKDDAGIVSVIQGYCFQESDFYFPKTQWTLDSAEDTKLLYEKSREKML